MDGLFIPAHVFTPFKSLYGKGVISSLNEVFEPALIDAIELGLSADTEMVKSIKELEQYVILTNSDAHSLGKIAREYQTIRLEQASFTEFKKALREKDNRMITANYGLNPLLGKYHQTVCSDCSQIVPDGELFCPACHSKHIIKGVSTRIEGAVNKMENIAHDRPIFIKCH